MFEIVTKFLAVAGEKLNSIIMVGVVGRADHNTGHRI